MAQGRQGSRNNNESTIMEGSGAPEELRDARAQGAMTNPIRAPKKVKSEKEKSKVKKNDEEALVQVNEKDSLTESTIKVKQLTWVHAAGLMFTEYIVIAILSFPSSYSVLGLGGGVLTTIIVGIVVLFTSDILYRYCLENPGSTDIVDLSSRLFPPKWKKAAYNFVAVMFVLNNLFIMGLHVLSGSVALNTLSNHATCTIVFTVIMASTMFVLSLTRELNQVAVLGFIAAGTMFIAFLLCLVFLGIEAGPAGYTPDAPPTIRAWALPGTSFVSLWNSVLNVMYTYVGHILIPSYMDDMKRPEDFRKSLYLVTFLEILVYTLGGAIGYYYIGDQYMTSPAYGSLMEPYTKIVAAFTLPTLVVVGVLYSNVTSRFVFFKIYAPDSIHRLEHTVRGWTVWIGVVLVIWIISWIIGSAIPFFNELLSLMSSLFDFWFGFVLEALAFFAMYKGRIRSSGKLRQIEAMASGIVFVAGIFILVGGAYSSISAIKDDYTSGTVAGAFTCESNGF